MSDISDSMLFYKSTVTSLDRAINRESYFIFIVSRRLHFGP